MKCYQGRQGIQTRKKEEIQFKKKLKSSEDIRKKKNNTVCLLSLITMMSV